MFPFRAKKSSRLYMYACMQMKHTVDKICFFFALFLDYGETSIAYGQ